MLYYLFLFTFFSIIGWVLEVIFRSLNARAFVNPGFLRGPYLPIYGIGALILTSCVAHMQGSNLLIKCLVYLLVTTGLEFITGFIFEGCLNIRLWNYSEKKFRIKNYICLQFSIYWLLLAFAFEYLALPMYLPFLNLLNPVAVDIFAIVVSGVIFADWTVRCAGIIWERKGKRRLLSGDDESEFMDIAGPLIEHPAVQRLAGFGHHRDKTRLDHSVEVAWHSFLLSKRLSLDCDAIVKGALLHDLFFYDWLREGPRLHGFRHPWISLRNAREVTILSKKEEDIIIKHMWPLTIIPPRYMESWVVCLVDTCCTVKDYLSVRQIVWSSQDKRPGVFSWLNQL